MVWLLGDNLGTAIWQFDGIGASNILAIRTLRLGKVCIRVVVKDSVLEGTSKVDK